MVIVISTVLKILFILQFVNNSVQTLYDMILEDERIFSDCQEKLPNHFGMDKLFDLSKMSCSMSEEGVLLEGNMTFWWDVDPKDRLEVIRGKNFIVI